MVCVCMCVCMCGQMVVLYVCVYCMYVCTCFCKYMCLYVHDTFTAVSTIEIRIVYVTVYGKIGHNEACVDVAKRSI